MDVNILNKMKMLNFFKSHYKKHIKILQNCNYKYKMAG